MAGDGRSAKWREQSDTHTVFGCPRLPMTQLCAGNMPGWQGGIILIGHLEGTVVVEVCTHADRPAPLECVSQHATHWKRT